jgi:PKD repeat protein
MPMARLHRNVLFAAATASAIVLSTLVSVDIAVADTSPPDTSLPQTVSADSLPTTQINGVVWDQEIVGNTVFVGGNFTTARPAGAAAGSNEVARTYLLSYDLTTGALTNWAPVLNGQVRAIAASPDGSRLYAVGAFTTVNGVSKNRLVAFDTATGAVISSFAGSANGEVFAVAATASTVYFGGNFSQSNGVSRPGRAAAATAATGATTLWAPVLANGRAYGIVVSPDETKVVIAGSFTTLNGSGNPGYGMGAVTSTTGTSLPWAANSVLRDAGDQSAVYGLSSDSDSVYASGYVFGTGGNSEGTSRIAWDGTLKWMADCRGDNFSAASQGSVVYITGHSHQCQWVGGFPQNNPTWVNMRALAYTKEPSGIVRADTQIGQPATKQLAFFPAINAGSFTGQNQGAWDVHANSQYVLYAGEFTQINGVAQQGLSRFALPSVAPNREGPQLSADGWPLSTASYSPSTVRVSWPSNSDRDNEQLTYRVIRDGDTASPAYITTGLSRFWDQPTINWVDTGLGAGSNHTYRVSATDPYGNVAWTNTVSQTTAAGGTYSPYAQAVTNDSPTFYYRLGESSGTTVNNLSGPVGNTTQELGTINTVNATAGAGVSRGVTGPISGDPDTASKFNGNSNGRAVTSQQVYSDDSMSVETWFRTTSASGKMIGFGSNGSVTGNSATYDQSLYLSGGKVSWSVYDSATRTIQSPASYNNGSWHHAVATLGGDGMKLYVDGSLVATRASTTYARGFYGYWKIGGDSTPSGNMNFSGDLDEVAIYKTVLPAEKVTQHYQLRTGTASNVSPTAAITVTANALTATADGSASTDSDGSITAWAWAWGDGTTSTGAAASHTYASAGTYTVTLTVTDNGGATGTTNKPITVTSGPPPVDPGTVLAQDSFSRTFTGGWGTATTGGSWTPSSAANSSVNGSLGVFAHTAGTTRRAVLGSVSSAATTASANVSIDKAAAGSSTYAGVVVRQVGSAFYQARARFLPDGTVALQLMQGSSTVLANATIPGLTYALGSQLAIKVEATGSSPTSLSAKLWIAGTAEPSAWTLTTTDATAGLQAAGSVGVESYVSAASTNVPLNVRFDEFAAVVPGGTPPPVNQAPTASFTTSVSSLTASVDGTASSDPDGTVASWSWAFGDGSAGTGSSSSHTYGAAGTYTITLTVTDDAGATATTTRSVTVTAPAAPTVLAADAFERVSASGWGSADTGGTWATATGTNYVVNSGSAAAIHGAGTTRRSLLSAVSTLSSDVTVQVSLDKASTGGGVSVGAVGRQIGADFYQGRIRFISDGTVGLQLLSGSSTVLANTAISGLSYSPGATLVLRVQVFGTSPTTLRGKVWALGSTEPAAWQLTTTDATVALQAAGSIGLEGYLSGSATNAPLTVRYDNFSASTVVN